MAKDIGKSPEIIEELKKFENFFLKTKKRVFQPESEKYIEMLKELEDFFKSDMLKCTIIACVRELETIFSEFGRLERVKLEKNSLIEKHYRIVTWLNSLSLFLSEFSHEFMNNKPLTDSLAFDFNPLNKMIFSFQEQIQSIFLLQKLLYLRDIECLEFKNEQFHDCFFSLRHNKNKEIFKAFRSVIGLLCMKGFEVNEMVSGLHLLNMQLTQSDHGCGALLSEKIISILNSPDIPSKDAQNDHNLYIKKANQFGIEWPEALKRPKDLEKEARKIKISIV